MPTSIPRTLLADFALANPTYAGAQIAVYEVDANLARTATLAPLYAAQSGATALANPQLLNSNGQNAAPIYVDRPVIVRVTRGATAEDLGVQGVSGRWRGVWAAATTYYVSERVRDPAGPSTYLALVSHTSSGSFATDLANGRWEQEIDAASMGSAAVEAVFPPSPGRNGKLLGFNVTTGDPEEVARDSVLVAQNPTTGTATAQVVTLPSVIAGYTNGLMVLAEIGITFGDAPQLNAGFGLKKIYASTPFGPAQAMAGEAAAGNWVLFTYDATQDGGAGGWVMQQSARPAPASGESLGILLNPFQEVSLLNGTASVTLTSAFTPTISAIGAVESCATLTASTQQVADPLSSFGAFRRLRFGVRTTIGTLQASLAAGEILSPWRQLVPGTGWRGLAWGTADARAVDVLAIVMASVAGTYALALRNGAAARSYISTVTLGANTPTVVLLRVPGDTTGTWPTDDTTALTLDIGAVTGSTFQASTLNAWGAGDFLSHASATNWGGTSGATFLVSYADIFPAGVLPFADASQITGEALQRLLNLRRPFDLERARVGFEPSPIGGLRNLVINGNPLVNQRGYVSGAATGGANQYTLDRWRVVVSGQALSWTDSAGVRTCTAPAGGVEQVIEGTGLIGGTYTLNWGGTATATVNGAAVQKGGQVSLPGGTNVTLRLSGGTYETVQLEPGRVATPFEFRPQAVEVALCQRYFQRVSAAMDFAYNAPAGGSAGYLHIQFPVEMRVAPVVSLSASGGINVSVAAGTTGTTFAQIVGTSVAAGLAYWRTGTATTFSAEL